MKKSLVILAVSLFILSCNEKAKTSDPEQKPLTVSEMQSKIEEKEKNENGGQEKKQKPGKGNRTASGFVNGGLSPIVGEGSVAHGPEFDTLRLKVTHWGTNRADVTQEAMWWHYSITHIDANAPYPGRFTATNNVNYNNTANPVPSEWMELWPHQGLSVSYFFGVSSDGGWNYGGITITNQ